MFSPTVLVIMNASFCVWGVMFAGIMMAMPTHSIIIFNSMQTYKLINAILLQKAVLNRNTEKNIVNFPESSYKQLKTSLKTPKTYYENYLKLSDQVVEIPLIKQCYLRYFYYKVMSITLLKIKNQSLLPFLIHQF